MRTRTWRHERLLFIAALLAIGCADSTLRPDDKASGDAATTRDASSTEGDAAADAGGRLKPRTVMVDLPPIASRTLREGPDGRYEYYGDYTPVDGAKVCIIQRREVYAAFEPFETLREPICVLSSARQVVRIPSAPANSDLIITIEHEGLQPVALTNRTFETEATVPWEPGFSLIMLEEGASEAWIEPEAPSEEGYGTLFVLAASLWTGPGTAAPELLVPYNSVFGSVSNYVWARGVDLTITPAGGGDPIAFRDGEGHTLSLPPGSARLEFTTDNPHFHCGAAGEYLGLSVKEGLFEVPIVAGHDHFAGPVCACGGASNEDELVDLESCRFTSDDAATP